MELEIIKKDGKTFLLMPDELVASLRSSSEAKMAEAVKPRDDEIAHLKEEVGQLESQEHAQEVFTEFARKLTPEGFVELAGILGYEAQLPEASVAEVAEAEPRIEVLEGDDPFATGAQAAIAVAEPIVVAESVVKLKPVFVYEDPHDSDYWYFPNLAVWSLRPSPPGEAVADDGKVN